MSKYERAYEWAYTLAKKALEAGGEQRLQRLFYDLRGEETPGGFLKKLATEAAELALEGAQLSRSDFALGFRHGDDFYLFKAAVLFALADAAATEKREGVAKREEGGGGNP